MGSWYLVLLFLMMALGAYMIIKRKLPKFFSSRLVGFYVLLPLQINGTRRKTCAEQWFDPD